MLLRAALGDERPHTVPKQGQRYARKTFPCIEQYLVQIVDHLFPAVSIAVMSKLMGRAFRAVAPMIQSNNGNILLGQPTGEISITPRMLRHTVGDNQS